MDFLNRSSAQLKDLFQSMTPGSRITAGLLLAAVVISLGYLVTHEVPGSGVYLMGGETFPPRELPAMEAAFAKAELNGYEIEGGRIRVPRDQQHTYIAALAEGGALPHGFGDALERALDDGSVWDTNEQRQQRTKLGIQRELALTIGEMNGIDTARVFYDEQKAGGWRQEVVRTASVSVRPMGSQALDESLVPAIRNLIVGAVAGLKPEDVAVTDLNSGRTFRGGASGGVSSAMDDPYLARKQFHEKHYRDEILKVLSYVPGAIVTCNVELDHEQIRRQEEVKHDPKTVPSSVTETTTTRTFQGASPGGAAGYRGQVVTNASASLNSTQSGGSTEEEEQSESQQINALSSTRTETAMAAHPIKRVAVAVAVPESYFKKVWEGRNPPDPAAGGSVEPKTPDPAAVEQIRTQEVANIRSCVAGYLPPPSDGTSAGDLVTVTVFPDFKSQETPEPAMSTAALSWLARSWSTLGLIGLAFVSLLMLRSMIRSAPASAPERVPAAPGPDVKPDESNPDFAGETPQAERRRRFNTSGGSLKSELSDLVSSDPDTAANILRNWIGSPT
jgi:flagellar M-ring protein FliF